ncbi:hypothetical protein VF07_35265 [Nostoc linckia z6]|jgi:hypothetical protein|uniref:Uncharacterized protein n=1 Tax=Nostoc linckia z8 TaxID=1628746 RepID=A0A9Q5Z7V2_NOSLI|nr:hypothetical protein VF03_33080 [Nostoc linckia z2]PHJ78199.1 hypothetical protein VF07_35265 [Nostoc linckia z6]PHJ98238.1 hypothetical protein VF08_27170 [Nostoc linckia z8]
MFVQRDDQLTGLIHLLSLALRLLTIIEFVVRRQLITQSKTLTGPYPDNPKKQTDRPTAERLLRAFSNLTLTIIEVRGQRFGYVPPLTFLHQEIITDTKSESAWGYSFIAHHPIEISSIRRTRREVACGDRGTWRVLSLHLCVSHSPCLFSCLMV